jgi:hypothetical protein
MTKKEIFADQKLYLYTVVNITRTLIGRGYDSDKAKLLAYQYADAMIKDDENASRILFDLLNDKIAWKAYEEVEFSPDLILRWIREGDFYVSRIDKELMEKLKIIVEGHNND